MVPAAWLPRASLKNASLALFSGTSTATTYWRMHSTHSASESGSGSGSRGAALAASTSPVSIASVKGGRDYMEDEFFVAESERYKLLAVYDGHGGKDVSKYMKDHFYKAFENTLFHSISGASASASSDATTDCVVSNALKKALSAVDDDILTGPTSRKLHYQGSTSCMLYLEKSGSQDSPFTSVVSANVGDSRAVMARGLKSVELTEDHKPNDPLERQRVESLGGSVTWHGRRDKAGKPIENTGVYRVNRNLALSRSMGDRYMRPYVIAEPDFVRMPITSEDEFVVVATDGVWDVISSQECVTMIHQILQEYSIVPNEVQKFSAVEKKEFQVLHKAKIDGIKDQMASIITAIALRRGSSDNITVLIQWLK